MPLRRIQRALPAALILLLGACAQTASHQSVAVLPHNPAAEIELEQIRQDFHLGEYGKVIREVARSQQLPAASPEQYSEALKLQAFSFCIQKYTFLCQDRFSQARKLNPGFELSPAEIGHPEWGPAYQASLKEKP